MYSGHDNNAEEKKEHGGDGVEFVDGNGKT